MTNIDESVNEQGNFLGQTLDTALGMFGKGGKVNSLKAQSVKAQLIQATLDAFGVKDEDRGDAKKVAELMAQVGIPKGNPTKKEIKNIQNNIRRIYDTRISQKNNEINRFLNPTNIGIADDDTGGL